MEVLAGISSIISVVDIAARTGQQLYRLMNIWRDIPVEFTQLQDDIIQTKELFESVQNVGDGTFLSTFNPELTRLLQDEIIRVHETLTNISNVINHIASISDTTLNSTPRPRRLRWLKERDKILRFQNGLKISHGKVITCLVSLNVSVTKQIHSTIKQHKVGQSAELVTAASEIQNKIKTHLDMHFTGARAEALSRLSVVQKQVLISQNSGLDHLGYRFQKMQEQLSSNLNSIEESHKKSVLAITNRMDALENHMDSGWIILLENQREHIGRVFQDLRALMAADRSPQQMLDPRRWDGVGVSSPCNPACLCRCHKSYVAKSFRLTAFKELLGTISFAYWGLFKSKETCNHSECHRQRQSSCRVTYTFPRWLWAVATTYVFQRTHYGPELLIRVSRVLSVRESTYHTSIISRARMGDVEGVKRILRQYPSSVLDICTSHGGSALAAAASTLKLDVCELLLQAGSDIFQLDWRGTCPLHILMNSIFVTQQYNWLEVLMPLIPYAAVADWISNMPLLHKAILGIEHTSLKEALVKFPYSEHIERSDSYSTPLIFAISRGDLGAVDTLLEAGADPNAVSYVTQNWRLPLAAACMVEDVEVVRTLLKHGANPHGKGPGQQWSSMHIAAQTGSIALISILLEAAGGAESFTSAECPLIAFATRSSNTHIIHYLIEQGFDMNQLDRDGDGSLFEAIFLGFQEPCRILLSYGANYRNININGRGVLHMLGFHGTIETMGVFTEAQIHGLNLLREDLDGRTPLQCFNARDDITPELRKAFEGLLESVERGNLRRAVDIDAGEVDNDEEFFDACDGP